MNFEIAKYVNLQHDNNVVALVAELNITIIYYSVYKLFLIIL